MRIGISQHIGRKKKIDQVMMIGIDKTRVMILCTMIAAEMRAAGMIIRGMILDATTISVMTDMMSVIGKMTAMIVGTIMIGITHSDGITIITNLIGVVDIKTIEGPLITEVMMKITHQIVDSMKSKRSRQFQ